MRCIVCQHDMEFRCPCGAAWLSEDKLVEMAQDMKGGLVALPWQSRDGAPRACPHCSAPMATVALDGVALDRCAAHGIWFDADELHKVLSHAATFPAPRPDKNRMDMKSYEPTMITGARAPGPVEDAVSSFFLGVGTLLDLL
jgi:Zn-finger nucleic acid-binding protein